MARPLRLSRRCYCRGCAQTQQRDRVSQYMRACLPKTARILHTGVFSASLHGITAEPQPVHFFATMPHVEVTVILVRGSAFQLPFLRLHLGFQNLRRRALRVLGLRKGGPLWAGPWSCERDPCPSRMSMATFFALCANYDRE